MIRVRQWLAAGVAGGLCLAVTACGGNNPDKPSSTASAEKVNIGGDLYTAAPMPKLENPVPQPEPVVIPAVVQNDIKVQIAAQVDALVEMIATPLEPGAKYDPKDPDIVFHPRDTKKEQPYRRLKENDTVKEGQFLARLDEQVVALQYESSKALIDACGRAIAENKRAAQAYKDQYETQRNLPGVARFELLSTLATVARLEAEVINAEREKVKAESEMKTAETQLQRYWVQSKINGRIVKLLKSPQEFAKAGDPIMEIQRTDRVRVEGKVDAQYADRVRKGMRAVVEPARPIGPAPVYNPGHRLEVTGIVVTAHKGRPLIVSGGKDGNVLVWDVIQTKQSFRLPHPTGVRSVACTGTGSRQHYLATGGDDGKVRLWDLSTPDKLPREPKLVFEEGHASPVTAAAFSPNGQFLATAAGRDVFVWDVAAGKRKYALPAEHRDAVTTVRFTPQCTLVTAARDKSIRVWKLGDAGAATQSVIEHRGGTVDVLGVSSDGAKVLFDKDAARLDVLSLGDERSIGSLQGAGGGSRFAGLALYSSDDAYVLTAGGDADQRGELTLWEAPQPGGRGAERFRLMTPRGAAVTCAAFSPDPDHRFLVVGTAEGGVHLWTPSLVERGRQMTGEVVLVSPADARSFQVRVEMVNPTDKAGESLPDRSLATIIITPDGGAAPMPLPGGNTAAVVPAVGVGNPGGVVQAGAVGPVGAAQPPLAAPPAAQPPLASPGGVTVPPVPVKK